MRQLTCALVLTVSLVGAHGASAQVFPGTGVGAIPDGLAGTPPQFGPPLNISFAVTGATTTLETVAVDVTVTHTWVGDLEIVLRAPGGAPSHTLVSRVGAVAATGVGDSSNYGGPGQPYQFTDAATGTNLWTVATLAACGDTCVVAYGLYRTTAPGGAGATNPPALTSLHATFKGLTPLETNGTWTLVIRDGADQDVGTATVAWLNIPDPLSDLIFEDGFQA